MGHYKSNLRDIEFNLFEVLRRQDLLGSEPYPALDEETVRGILDAGNRLAGGPSFPNVLGQIGTAEQRRFAELAVERKWGATMVLTEPDAGSDVGAGRTKATEAPDGTWHIEGTKRFITSGDWDIPENIFHMVLARPEGHGPGTKGLSMFVVPKFMPDPSTGAPGARNGVYV